MALTATMTKAASFSAGDHFLVYGTVSVTGDNSTAYTDEGVAITVNGLSIDSLDRFRRFFGFNVEIKKIVLGALFRSDQENAWTGYLDTTNGKVILFGGAAANAPLSELSGTPTAHTWTGDYIAIGK
jgi:hypothetical protein